MHEIPPLRWEANWSSIWDRLAAAVPDAPAIVESRRTLCYRELEDRAARLAGAFDRLGIGSGDAVCICHYNQAEYLEAVYAAFKLGAIPVNLNYRYKARELAELLRIARTKAGEPTLGMPVFCIGHLKVRMVWKPWRSASSVVATAGCAPGLAGSTLERIVAMPSLLRE